MTGFSAPTGWPESIACWKAARAPALSRCFSSSVAKMTIAVGAASWWPEAMCQRALVLRLPPGDYLLAEVLARIRALPAMP
jgi:hypothetical protein